MRNRITANYLDRSNKSKKWMVRQEGESPKQAIQVQHVIASNVVFVTSDSTEKDLGCELVGVTNDEVRVVVGRYEAIDTDGFQKIQFGCGELYFYDGDGRYIQVTKAETVILTSTGIFVCGF